MTQYKGFEVPSGSDPANVPQSFRDFVDSLGPSFGTTALADAAGVPDNVVVNINGSLMYRVGSTWHYVRSTWKSSAQADYPAGAVTRDIRAVGGKPMAATLEVLDPNAGNAANNGWSMAPGVPRHMWLNQAPAYSGLHTGQSASSSILSFTTKQALWFMAELVFHYDAGPVPAGNSAFFSMRMDLQYSFNNGTFQNIRTGFFDDNHLGWIGAVVMKRTVPLNVSVSTNPGNHRFRAAIRSELSTPTGSTIRPVRYELKVIPAYSWSDM